MARKLNAVNLETINEAIINSNFSNINSIDNTNDRWLELKNNLLSIIDATAPLAEITINDHEQFEWLDDELREIKYQRDTAYKNFKRSNCDADHNVFVNYRQIYQNTLNKKMIEYFKNKSMNDFKNSKKFWEFYSSHVKIRTDKACNLLPTSINNGNSTATNSTDIGNMFNFFFSSLSSDSSASSSDCQNFSSLHLQDLIDSNKLLPKSFKLYNDM